MGAQGEFGIGIIGSGNISSIYIKNLSEFPQTRVVAISDLDHNRAKAKAEEHGITDVLTTEELLAREDIDAVVNLTIPAAHYDLAMDALRAGKHIYNEKPLAMNRVEGRAMLDLAKAKGKLVGCAPDTVLGAGIQTVREMIDRGDIGDIVSAQAWMMGSGTEKWHPNPEFFYKPGAGPLFDMGPYYLTAMVTLLGPVKEVAALHRIALPTRLIESQPFAGQTITVETPTHISLVAAFQAGPIGQFTASFDTFAWPEYPCMDIFGTKGMIRVPDPNCFGGPIKIRPHEGDWKEIEITRPYGENSRGLGVLDMMLASKNGRAARASGDVAAHVLDVIQSALESGSSGKHIPISI
ncbi:MAG: Gfo/Idh/MocA family oxidoreductase, partial [Armatimonadota bacterium]